MTFKFQPLGIPESSSLAINANAALSVRNLPDTGSFAEYSLGNPGPAGPVYKTTIGTIIDA